MRFIWEADDIGGEDTNAAGTIVTDVKDGENEYWMIGIRPADGDTPARYCLISLRDGTIRNPMSAEDLASHLTNTGMKPISEHSTIETYIRDGRVGLLSI